MNDDTPNPTYQNVTPEIAAKWLTYNVHNRPMNDRNVTVLAGAMSRGEWMKTANAIQFSKPPVTLLDGQKRLAAVVKSGCTVPMLVAEGLDHEAQMAMDVGQKRSFSNTLKLMDVPYYTETASILAKLYHWRAGQFKRNNRPPTFAQLLELHNVHGPALVASIRVASSVHRQILVSKTILGLMHFLFVSIDTDDCEGFFNQLRDGYELQEGDPIYALRKTLLNNLSTGPSRGRYDDTMLMALLIKAWNAYRKGETVKVLSWRAGGATPEAFPTPI